MLGYDLRSLMGVLWIPLDAGMWSGVPLDLGVQTKVPDGFGAESEVTKESRT